MRLPLKKLMLRTSLPRPLCRISEVTLACRTTVMAVCAAIVKKMTKTRSRSRQSASACVDITLKAKKKPPSRKIRRSSARSRLRLVKSIAKKVRRLASTRMTLALSSRILMRPLKTIRRVKIQLHLYQCLRNPPPNLVLNCRKTSRL